MIIQITRLSSSALLPPEAAGGWDVVVAWAPGVPSPGTSRLAIVSKVTLSLAARKSAVSPAADSSSSSSTAWSVVAGGSSSTVVAGGGAVVGGGSVTGGSVIGGAVVDVGRVDGGRDGVVGGSGSSVVVVVGAVVVVVGGPAWIASRRPLVWATPETAETPEVVSAAVVVSAAPAATGRASAKAASEAATRQARPSLPPPTSVRSPSTMDPYLSASGTTPWGASPSQGVPDAPELAAGEPRSYSAAAASLEHHRPPPVNAW